MALIGVQRALLRPKSGGSVTLDATGVIADIFTTGGAITYTNMTVGAGASLLLVCLAARASSVSDVTAVNWDSAGTPQAMTLLQSEGTQSSTVFAILVFGLVAPTAGNKTLAVTTTGAGQHYGVCAASFKGSNPVLANAVPSGSIVHGHSGGVVASRLDTASFSAGHMGLILDHSENAASSSAAWSPTATQSNSSLRMGMLVGSASPLSLTITPNVSDACGGIAVDISP